VDCTVVIGTFGEPSWVDRALRRAAPSATRQGLKVIHRHRETLHEARNAGLERVRTPWVIHLDADDELEPGFMDAMRAHFEPWRERYDELDLIAPAVRYVSEEDGRELRPPWMPQVAGHRHTCVATCLEEGNWLVVGTLARTKLLREVGGWRDFPVYEDWDLWLRCHRRGAQVGAAPNAIYRAHVRQDSRNRAQPMEFRNNVHRQIVAANAVQPAPRDEPGGDRAPKQAGTF
jgi:GT2 family glycosyltransferase